MLIPIHIPNQKVQLPILEEKQITLFIKRLDLIHPLVSGNKFFKLKYNLSNAKAEGYKRILTFGGAFSNHIHAVAGAVKEFDMEAIGVIRGEETEPLNPTLSFAKETGMEFHYLDRNRYRLKNSSGVLRELESIYGSFYLIPEGGTNVLAIKGASEILNKEDAEFDQIAVSIGTGGTVAGLASSLAENQGLLGFSSLKGDFIHKEIVNLFISNKIKSPENFQIFNEYHFGGYAKHKEILIDFMMDFFNKTAIPLDPIYTGKMLFGIMDLIKNDFFKKGTKILAIHTGGLQGNIGFNQINDTRLPY